MAIQKTDAIVLKTQKLRSSSLIVTFFSKSFGKLKGIAKGVRKEREVRGAFYELFTHLEIIFYEKNRSDLHLISEASILKSNDHLRTRLETITYASYFAELVDSFCEVHDPHEEVFEMLNFAFRFIPSISGEKMARLFEIKLLHQIGLLPYLDHCLGCQKTNLAAPFFSVAQGGIFCSACARPVADAKPISIEALNILRYFSTHQPEECLRQPILKTIEKELMRLMEFFFRYRLGHILNSRRFLQDIQPVLALR
ncbi:MAG: DNA repair protein RecO [Candidatus Omnitrophica bacterium]|nr:DNA repair protein RecO [Candidatus Omnitrophota bacterium]